MNDYARQMCGEGTPETVLDIDAAITRPGDVTLEELEALNTLEPYGSGNTRPVFCLLGATLLRTQNVGQNRHLKLREGDTAFLVLQRNKRVSLDDAPLVAFLKQSMEKGGGAL